MALLKINYKAVLILILFAIACENVTIEENIDLDSATKQPLCPKDSIQPYGSELISRMYLLQDSVVVTHNEYYSNGSVIGLSTLSDTSNIWFGQYGIENGKMMNTIVSRSQDMVLLYDIAKKTISVLNIATEKEKSTFNTFKTEIKSQCIIPIEQGRCLFLNPYSFKGKEQRVIISSPCFYYKRLRVPNYDAINVVLGSIMYNSKQGIIAFANRVEPAVELLNHEGRLIKKINFRGYDSYEQQYYYETIGKIGYYSFLEQVKQSFTDGCCSDNYIALLYQPNIISPTRLTQFKNSLIIILNWAGDLLNIYEIKENVICISLSQDGQYLYSFEDRNGKRTLIKYAINAQ